MKCLYVLLVAILLTGPAQAVTRSHAVLAQFQKAFPCPATGKTTGSCPGWIKDHIIPLCAGGVDSVENLQWQTIEAAKIKDKLEIAACRHLRLCTRKGE